MYTHHSTEIDMLHGPLLPKMFLFMVPLILSSALQLLFNAADVIVVGRFAGSDALAAVGTTGTIVSLAVNFTTGFTVGVNHVVAKDIAGETDDEADADLHTAIMAFLLYGILAGILGILGARSILRLIKTPEGILEEAVLYLTVYFAGFPGIALYNAAAAVTRSWGDTEKPMVCLTVAGILNVLLNLFFVIVMKLGVVGVALATSLSNYLSCSLMLASLMKKSSRLRLYPSRLHINRYILQRIMATGIPSGLQLSMYGITNLLIQSAINTFGPITIAATAAAINIESFTYIPGASGGTAVLTFMSQNYGAGKFSRMDKCQRTGTLLAICMDITLSCLILLLRVPLLGLYTHEDEIIRIGCIRLLTILPAMWFDSIMNGYSAGLRCLGYARQSLIISVCTICLFRVAWLGLIFPLSRTYVTVLLSWPASWVLNILVNFIYYRRVRPRFPSTDALS